MAFADDERDHLRSQPLARLVTVAPDGRPDVTPVALEVEGTTLWGVRGGRGGPVHAQDPQHQCRPPRRPQAPSTGRPPHNAGTIRLNLRDAIPLYNRGLARRATGDVDGAIADYEFGARLAAPHDEMFRKRLDELQTHRGP